MSARTLKLKYGSLDAIVANIPLSCNQFTAVKQDGFWRVACMIGDNTKTPQPPAKDVEIDPKPPGAA